MIGLSHYADWRRVGVVFVVGLMSFSLVSQAQVFTKPAEKRPAPSVNPATRLPAAKPHTAPASPAEPNGTNSRADGGVVTNDQINEALGRLRFKPGRWRTYVNGHALADDWILGPDKWQQFRFSLLMLDGFDWDSNCPSSTCGAWPSENAKVSEFLIDNGNIKFQLAAKSWALSARGNYNYDRYTIVVNRSPGNTITRYVASWIGP